MSLQGPAVYLLSPVSGQGVQRASKAVVFIEQQQLLLSVSVQIHHLHAVREETVAPPLGPAGAEGAVRTAHFIFERMSKITNFGNGRYVRNLVDNAISNQSLRLSREHDDVDCVPKEDLFALTEEDITEPTKSYRYIHIHTSLTYSYSCDHCRSKPLIKTYLNFNDIKSNHKHRNRQQ